MIRQAVNAQTSFAPVEMYAPDGTFVGMSADYLRLVAGKLGLGVDVRRFKDWPEAIAAVGDDRADLAATVLPSAERARQMILTRGYLSSHKYIVALRSRPSIRSEADLAGKKVAIEQGFAGREALAQRIPGVTFLDVANSAAALKAVFAGEADAYVGNGLVISYLIEHLDLPSLALRQEVDTTANDMVFGVNRREPELASLINRALESITPEEQAEIRRRWVPNQPPSMQDLVAAYWPYLAVVLAGFALAAAWVVSLRREVRLRIRAEAAARAALSDAESATRFKSEFLASMSHEIRTPMNGILGMAYLALQASLPPPARQHVLAIQRSAKSLLAIINDILDLSRLEAGKLTIQSETFELGEVLDHVVALTVQAARDKGLAFIIDVEPSVPTTFTGDPLRIGQVLVNLCSNAVKFTAAGEVVVQVRSDPAEVGDAVVLRVRVRDTGIGISEDAQRRLFQPFEQADLSTSREFGGTGLGLVISRRLALAMQGELTVTSEPGHGATFEFIVPLRIATAVSERVDLPQGVPATADGAGLDGRRVLLVDDNEINQALAYELLSGAGMQVSIAENGEQALAMLAHAPFDLVLMDCQMPVMDGYDATRAIRRDPRWRGLVVIAMTANAMSGDRAKALEAGMNDHIAKPIEVPQMFATLRRWVARTE